MILLQINTTVNTGSTGRIAEEIGQRALAAGYDSYIAYGRSARESRSKLIRIGSSWSVRLHGLASLLFDAHGFASRRATKKLIKRIDAIHPDIVLLHNVHGYYLHIGLLLSYLKEKAVPVFWTLHDCWPFTGHCSYFDACDCRKWQLHCERCPNRKGYPQSLFVDRSRRNFDKKRALLTALPDVTFIPVCKWMGGIVEGSFMKGRPQHVIYNGTDTEVFRPQEAGALEEMRKKYHIEGKHVILGVASIWDSRKGLPDFEWLQARLPEECRIALVGLSDQQIEHLPKGIVGIRRTESVRELAALYSLADVFVNPTYVDNFPTTNIEALACGTPVVTYDTGGSPEAIDARTGIVVPKGDREGLKNAILSIISRKAECSGDACRERALSHFNKDDRFGDYIELFNKAIAKE